MAAELRRSLLVALLVACAGLTAEGAAPVFATPTGCASSRPAVAYYPGDSTPSPPSTPPLVPCRYDTGARALEPSLGFTRDGRVLYQGWELQAGSVGGVPPRPVVKRSNNDFTSWQDVSPIGPIDSLDPFMTVDRYTGRIFSVNWLGNGDPNCATISYSDDDGDNWISSPAACNGFDGESIGVGPPVSSITVGYPNIVYYCTGATPGSSPPATTPVCSKSLDGGLTFVLTGAPPWPVTGGGGEEDEFGPWAGNPIVGPDGTLYVPKRFAGQPEVAISHDEGLTWTRVQVAGNGSSGAATRMAVDDNGNLYYAWTGDDHLPYLAHSANRGVTWSSPIALAPPGLREAALPRPAATGNGRIIVAFLGSTDSTGPPYYPFCNELLGECDDGTYANVTWNGYMTYVADALADQPRLQTATVNPPGEPLFTGGCSADGACKADLDFIDAQFDPNGRPWAAFVDDCALARDYTPIFGPDAGRCSDFLGEGVVARLVQNLYPRPRSASRLSAALVPAFTACESPSAVHAAPLDSPSCSPPTQVSSHLTVGAPDANGRPVASTGNVRFKVVGESPIDPGNGDQADIEMTASLTDVRRRSDLTDYMGELEAVVTLLITDRFNGAGGSYGAPATVSEARLSFTVPCAATSGPEGATCSASTTADAVLPDVAREGQRAVWELGRVQVFDGGADGDAETAGNTLFAVQGTFVP